jgi:hypothetical protein
MARRTVWTGVAAIALGLALLLCAAPSCADPGRRGIFQRAPVPAPAHLLGADPAPAPTPATGTSSPFTLGTLLGLAVPFAAPDTYAVRDGVIVRDRSAAWYEWVQPALYLLPSVALWGRGGYSLSVIVPAGLTGGRPGASYGFGVSVGIATRASVEVGLALALVWTQQPRLSDGQLASFSTGQPIAAGVATEIGTVAQPGLVFGVYLTPLF